MTRDEEILTACKGFLTRYPSIDQAGLSIGFLDGAVWSDKHPNLESLWHDASEFPNKALPIIVEIDDDIEHSYEVISIDETDEKFWEYLVSDRDITIWAYIKDLLRPNGLAVDLMGKTSKQNAVQK